MTALAAPMVRKLSKAERRSQLLQAALELVRREGTDALTLAVVAERAGVSKPIAYDHFTSRAGLLIALYAELDEQHLASAAQAVARAPKRLQDVARVLSDAYMDCYQTIGPEWHAIAAALKGSDEMEAYHQQCLDQYAAIYVEAFAPYTTAPGPQLRIACVGLLGAADHIAREMQRGHVDAQSAADSLCSLMVGCFSPKP
jgi:AcrR family transcriptional regulator